MVIPRHNHLLMQCAEALGDAVNGTAVVGLCGEFVELRYTSEGL